MGSAAAGSPNPPIAPHVCVSNWYAPRYRPLRLTARRHDLVSVVVGDRRESEWPASGLVDWTDAESGARRLVDTSNRGVRQALGQGWAARRRRLLETLKSSRSDAVEIFAGEPYERALITFFKLRERRLQT